MGLKEVISRELLKNKGRIFYKFGVNAIWMTPIVEQIHDGTEEGTGYTYGFHGYWTSDWTAIDPNFGTKDDLKNLVETHIIMEFEYC